MTTMWLRKAIIVCLFAIGLAGTGPALAQTITLPIPPIHSTVDANGVDLQTGFVTLSEHDLSIGDPANGGLAHTRRWLVEVQAGTPPTDGHGTNAGWRHGYILTLTLFNNNSQAVVTIGDAATVTFTWKFTTKWQWVCDQLGSWTLTQSGSTYTVTDLDGTVYTFSSQPNGTSSIGSYYGSVTAVGTAISKPSGEIITLNYKTGNYQYYVCSSQPCSDYVTLYVTRLISVQNNYGYQLHYDYDSHYVGNFYSWTADDWAEIMRVQAINLADTYCDPVADTCTGTFPAVTYTRTYSGYGTTATVTKPGGGTRTYMLWSGGIEGGSHILKSVRDGISSSPYLSFTYYYDNGGSNFTTQRVISANKNNVQYDYSYYPSGSYYQTAVSTNGKARWSAETNTDTNTVYAIDQGGAQQRFSWTGNGQIATFQFGTTGIDYSYDSRGNMTQAVYYDENYNKRYLYRASFDASCSNPKTCNQPNTTTDPLGNVTSYTYDPVHGGVTSVISPAAAVGGVQPQVRTSYAQFSAYYKNASGSLVAGTPIYRPTGTSTCITTASCAGTADEVKTSITYGTAGIANNLLPTAITTAAGDGSVSSRTTIAYDPVGNKVSEDGPLPGSADISTWTYNADRQATQLVGPDPDGAAPLHNRSVKTSYDANGQVTTVSAGTSSPDGSGFTELTRSDNVYDNYARKIRTTVTAGGAIQSRTDFGYDALDRLECTAVRMNPAVYATDATAACTLGPQGSFGPDRISHNVYDSYDRVTTIQTAYGTPLQRDEITRGYGAAGVISTIKDANGNLTSFTYDRLLRPTQTNYPSPTTHGVSSTTDYEQLTYDAAGRVTTRRLRDGKQISYTYDNLGRQTLAHMVNPVDANDRDIATSYDLLGRVTQVDDGAGKKVSFTYDALGRKLSESPQLTGGATSYQYDAAGRRTQLTWSDGFYVNYDYDTLGELLAIRENGATSGPGVLASFTYDDQGKPTGLTRGNGVNDSYSYDAASRLQTYTINQPTAGNSYSYGYNPAGQLVSRGMTNDAYAFTQAVAVNHNYTVNGLNQYTASGAVVPTYDGRGNMTSAGSLTYLYDSKNKLTTFGSNSLGYDAMGRLAVQASPATRFVYDGSDLIAETDANNAILRRYVHIPGTDNVLVWYEGADTSNRRWLAHDERGSTTLITDASGASLGINAYDEYGIPQSTNLGRFQYTGQTWLPELGMYYYKARIYSPSFGRFMQTDPTGYDDGPNWYNYVHGDPISYLDTSGNKAKLLTAQYQITGPDITVIGIPNVGDTVKGLDGINVNDRTTNLLWLGMAITPVDVGRLTDSDYLYNAAFNSTVVGRYALPDGGGVYRALIDSFKKAKFDGSATKTDDYHAIAQSPLIFSEALKSGTMFLIPSRGLNTGSALLQANTTYNGKTGVVEYIMPLDAGFYAGSPTITHALFIPGAPISGYPNNFGGTHAPYCPATLCS